MQDPRFPIDPLLPEILATLAQHTRLVLEAPPGAGKTTRVPPALLAAPWRGDGRILMLEPRRIAARAAAEFMARARGEEAGATVGYRIRFEARVSAATRIEVVTEGILTRVLQDDPALEGVAALLFDEFHERHLAGDLGLALALDVQQSLRPELRIVLMSATLDGERLARFLDAPRLSSAGRSFPVEVGHVPARRGDALEAQAARAVREALARHPGDVLVFLPGRREIARVQQLLGTGDLDGAAVLALHGELPVEQQRAVLAPDPGGGRRVVLATNVAESSVTLPGVRVVVDSGLAREPRYDPNSGFTRLATVMVSQASADQRAGRAGRVAAGWCWRLWPESQRLEPARRPEIAQAELAGLALELAVWGGGELRFPDPPPAGALAAGRDLLQALGALSDEGAPTPLGRRMLALGTDPRLAALLLAAPADAAALACDLAALLEARDPLRSRSDALAARWQALAAFRAGGVPADASRSALAALDRAARAWRQRLRLRAAPPGAAPAHALGALLAHAYPDRIARQHRSEPLRYQLANGRSVRLFDDSDLYGEPWLVVSELLPDPRTPQAEARISRALPVDERALRAMFPQRFVSEQRVLWDAAAQALRSEQQQRFGAIVLDSRPGGAVDPAQAAVALCAAVRQQGLAVLPWSEALAQWRERVQCLREWMPELGLPDLSDPALLDTLEQWLAPALGGATRLSALTAEALDAALRGGMDWALRQRIEALAPVRVRVPSGQERRIAYAAGAAPVLAVKLQELFGLADTPRIADGRVPLTLHLLSPAGRPLQVTQDLRGFWERTWPEVRREMKGRYPKHPWPEDPMAAAPTARTKRR